MDSRFQIFGAKTTPDIRSGFLGIVIGPETILPDMSGGPTDFREDCKYHGSSPYSFGENDLNAKARHLSVNREK